MTAYKTYLIDLDGTIYHGQKRLPSGKRFIERLKESNAHYLFVTNNSTLTTADVAKNLSENHDIPTTADQVYTSALATADYLKSHAEPNQKRVFMVGEAGLGEALTSRGFELVNDEQADFVVAGLDRQFTYEKLTTATLAIQNGAQFIATNRDTNLPNERGMLPGAGSLIAAIETATATHPVVIAKPELPIMTGALALANIAPSEALMVGDNYNTDILAGINAHIDTLLVYSGVSTPEEIAKVSTKPTYTVTTLDEWKI